MKRPTETSEPLLTNRDAVVVGQWLNRAFETFDPGELNSEQSVVLYMLLDRLMERLWDTHSATLHHLLMRKLIRMGFFEPKDEPR